MLRQPPGYARGQRVRRLLQQEVTGIRNDFMDACDKPSMIDLFRGGMYAAIQLP
jgi:hypothetical protein